MKKDKKFNFHSIFLKISENLYSHSLIKNLQILREKILDCKKNNKKIIIFGNGGSAAIASHFALDLTNVAKIKCVNFSDSSLMGIDVQKLNKGYSTPIYGFVYNRNWNEIAEFMKKQKRVPSFTTNENKVVAEYYLYGYSFTDYDPNKPAEYYIEISNSQEIDKIIPVEPLRYEKIKSGESYSIYRLKDSEIKK
jgi:hypothetical protein